MYQNQPSGEVKDQLIFYKAKRFKSNSCNAVFFLIFEELFRLCKYSSVYIYLLFLFFQKWSFSQSCLDVNYYCKLNVENGNLALMLFTVMQISVEIRNVDLMLFDVVSSTLRRRINQKTTLKQPWNVFWNFLFWIIPYLFWIIPYLI